MIKNNIYCLIIFLFILLSGCTHFNEDDPEFYPDSYSPSYSYHGHAVHSIKNYKERGFASWYGRRFNKRRTTSGEKYNMYEMTAAHKSLPLQTRVLVTNLTNGKKVIVKINDRGPFVSNRSIDLSYAAAKRLGMLDRGVAPVAIKTLA